MRESRLVANRRILVVDDEPDIRDSLSEALELVKCEVEQASNGLHALSVLSRVQLPSLILLDLMMPHMDGFDFIKERDQDVRLKNIPVIVISADGAADTKIKGLNVQGCLKKPIELQRLFDVVEVYCGPEEKDGKACQ
jgi:CheY-like chemotaxis protein